MVENFRGRDKRESPQSGITNVCENISFSQAGHWDTRHRRSYRYEREIIFKTQRPTPSVGRHQHGAAVAAAVVGGRAVLRLRIGLEPTKIRLTNIGLIPRKCQVLTESALASLPRPPRTRDRHN